MEYRVLNAEEIDRQLFREFERRQVVTKCWRKIEGVWQIKDVPFIDQWSEEDYQELVSCLQNTVRTGGVVYGGFYNGLLKGFVSVEGEPLGAAKNYMDLTSIHVSEDMRGRKIGRSLFLLAAGWAGEKGAEKLYISAHSAVETQAFYRRMGCVEAVEYNEEHVKREPCDCQMEYVITNS